MTAQQIADQYGDPFWVSTLKKEIESYAASRVAECREATVRECSEAAQRAYTDPSKCFVRSQDVVNAILSVAAPKPPVWQQDIENLQQRIDSLQQDLDTLKAKR